MDDLTTVAGQVTELAYALDTFYFLVCGALVMWMAAGFTMLESGLVRAKNTAEILTKNVGLYSIACIMFMLAGYTIMYPSEASNLFLQFGDGMLTTDDNAAADVIASGGDTYYSNLSDFFFQVVFVATAMSIVSGAVAERMTLWSFLLFAVVIDRHLLFLHDGLHAQVTLILRKGRGRYQQQANTHCSLHNFPLSLIAHRVVPIQSIVTWKTTVCAPSACVRSPRRTTIAGAPDVSYSPASPSIASLIAAAFSVMLPGTYVVNAGTRSLTTLAAAVPVFVTSTVIV